MREYLMVPGPTEVSDRVLQALVRPAIEHIDTRFVKVMDETCEMLGSILETNSGVLVFPGSGRVGLEAAAVSVFEPGDRVLCIVNGVFGRMFKNIVERIGAVAVSIDFDWDRAADPELVERKVEDERDLKGIVMVHNDTSTGVVNPLSNVAQIAGKHGLLFIADCISSAGGVEVNMDEIGADIVCTSSQKAIGGLLGLCIVAVSPQAWKAMAHRRTPVRSFSFDLYKWLKMWIPKEKGGQLVFGYRRQPITMATHLVYALHEAAKMVLEEGLQERFRRHAVAGEAMRSGLKALGLQLYPRSESYASNTVTAVRVPDGIIESTVRRIMKEKYGVQIAGGLEDLSGKILRIGHMANTADEGHILATLIALERALHESGFKVALGDGVDAAMQVFESSG